MSSRQVQGGSLTQYVYDVENRLINITKDGTNIANYQYDGDGGRTKKETAAGITRFVGSLYEETGASKADHIFLGSTRVATIRDGNIKYALQDHLGGTNVVTDATGTVEEIIEYQPFGKKARHDNYVGGTVSANHYFTGHFEDAESGLIFMGARYYDGELGRFITADTIVQSPGKSPQTFNRYSYTANNPVNLIDPDGHSFWGKIGGFFKKWGGTILSVAFTFVGMPFLGALVSSAFNTVVNGGSFKDFAIGFGVGLAAGYAGGGLGGKIGGFLGLGKASLETTF